ncbi:hypothetical protein NP233_g11727 [Leucocoprinus birnbaumii]|uniref:Sde2 N-terminal ubiquitin domain-containing protein n=1 Tax=Leucocoprinus birnbaumii TaxID=56174 RepID=A0AAD5YL24_9AGAR|nr:hypothetical protein NP233_g11727 [Leucocoprinus birnbaumii]
MASTTLLIDAFSPFNSLTLSLPSSTPIHNVYDRLCEKYPSLPPHLASSLSLSTNAGIIADCDQPLSFLHDEDDESSLVTLRLTPRLLGGKGGFGSQLRAAGGRMSSQKTSNNDSCRDLNGRRLSTIKEAKKLAEYLESEPERLAAKAEAQRNKLEALEKRLGIEHKDTSRKPGEVSLEVVSGKKHRFDDTEYLEQSRELVDGVKSAVSAGLLKKRKKAKTSPSPDADKGKGKEKEAAAEKNSEPAQVAPATVTDAPPVVAVPLDAVGA